MTENRRWAEPPRFQHDCGRCRFLGCFRNHDLYYCAGGPSLLRQGHHDDATVIARFGDEGKEYTSGLALAEHDPILAEALGRAKERGLL